MKFPETFQIISFQKKLKTTNCIENCMGGQDTLKSFSILFNTYLPYMILPKNHQINENKA